MRATPVHQSDVVAMVKKRVLDPLPVLDEALLLQALRDEGIKEVSLLTLKVTFFFVEISGSYVRLFFSYAGLGDVTCPSHDVPGQSASGLLQLTLYGVYAVQPGV